MVARKKYSRQLAVAALLFLGVVDIALSYVLASYGSSVCGWGREATGRGLEIQLLASTCFVGIATVCVVQLNGPGPRRRAWFAYGVTFVFVETALKVLAAMFGAFYLC